MSDDIQRRVQLGQATNLATAIVVGQIAGDTDVSDQETLGLIEALVPACLDLVERLQAASQAQANAQATVAGAFPGARFNPAPSEPVWSAAPAAQPAPQAPPAIPMPAVPGAGGSAEQKWTDYFHNPSEYFDNRPKTNPKSPDFKHKQTKVALWIDGRDTPQWVKNHFAQAA